MTMAGRESNRERMQLRAMKRYKNRDLTEGEIDADDEAEYRRRYDPEVPEDEYRDRYPAAVCDLIDDHRMSDEEKEVRVQKYGRRLVAAQRQKCGSVRKEDSYKDSDWDGTVDPNLPPARHTK